MKFFDESEVRRLLDWRPLIDAMATALAEFSAGKVIQPVRNMIVFKSVGIAAEDLAAAALVYRTAEKP